MLAQNFLSAEALGITEEQREALIKTLGAFERGEIPEDEFYMGSWACGTTACIGGWSERLANKIIFLEINPFSLPVGLQELFYPDEFEEDDKAICCRDINKGSAALRNYLTLGEPRWDEVMAE